MSNYEIMLILDPNSDDKIVSEIAKSSFKSKDVKIERLERTELAYEINKSKTAIYVLVTAKATGEEINEFNRKANIAKNIWRFLSVNLDTEKGLNRKAKPKRIKKAPFVHKKNKEDTLEKSNSEHEKSEPVKKENKEKPKKVVEKATTNKKTTKTKSKKEE